jgi:hypothetical protein
MVIGAEANWDPHACNIHCYYNPPSCEEESTQFRTGDEVWYVVTDAANGLSLAVFKETNGVPGPQDDDTLVAYI